MRFRFVEEHRGNFPANRLCHVVDVSTRTLAHGGCVPSAAVLLVAGSDLIWLRWLTSRDNRVSALAAMVGHG